MRWASSLGRLLCGPPRLLQWTCRPALLLPQCQIWSQGAGCCAHICKSPSIAGESFAGANGWACSTATATAPCSAGWWPWPCPGDLHLLLSKYR